MNTFLLKIKKACAAVFALLLTCTGTACQIPFPFTSDNSLLSHSSSTDRETSDGSQTPSTSNNEEQGDNDSSDGGQEDGTLNDEALEEAGRIMDLAYGLTSGQSLDGTYTLTGVVSEIYQKYSSSKGVWLYMDVIEPKNRELYCYKLNGAGADIIGVGDTITVEGVLTNYKGTIEFDAGCTIVAYTLANGTQGDTPDTSDDPYKGVSASAFYANYTVATSNEDAYYRSLHGFMSGELTVPDQAPTISTYQPKIGTAYLRNNEMHYEENGNAYVVPDAYGNKAFTVYKDGAYITLEEVAAYVYAFGTYPKNHVSSKDTKPSNSVWKEYLRLNHTKFSGNTKQYPYEPVLPNISGCGGTLTYYEMDVGTTGTDCDPSYDTAIYNNGRTITRGAARIVYGKTDLNKNGVYEQNEFHLFYTYNHYNDFQEYLNYKGGWGEKFGNITGGGKISSTSNYNPTPYVPIVFGVLSSAAARTALARYFTV